MNKFNKVIYARAGDHAPLPYRADIDGLRAIAVCSVVFFHAGIAALPGGFVGVDVFFVISGYLIGGQIFREVSRRSFNFADFYSRRVRRILPALFVLLLILYVVGITILTPQETRELSKEAVSAVFGMSNLLFYRGGDYFAPAADASPLLMTWSLGVEEQFYLLFPFVAFVLFGMRLSRSLSVLIALCVLSFAGSLALMHINPTAAFYLIPTRAWELGVGTVLALWEYAPRPPRRAGTRTQVAAAVALLALLGSMIVYRPNWAFPGIFVAFPVLATAVLIATSPALVNQRLLSLKPMRFVGLVSYSWYLWHWPIFYLNRTIAGSDGGASPLVLIILSFIMAVASWRFVERPFRHRVLDRKDVLIRYALIACMVAAPGALLYKLQGWPQRLDPDARRPAVAAIVAQAAPCLARYGIDTPDFGKVECMPPLKAGQTSRLVVLGDSHANAMSPGVAEYAERRGLGFGEITKSSCPALWGYAAISNDRAGFWENCTHFQTQAFSRVANDPQISTVVLTAFWASQLDDLHSDKGKAATPLSKALQDTIARLQKAGKRVILIQDVPTFSIDPYQVIVGSRMPARAIIAGWLGVASEYHVASP